ncbi:MAG: hypothetical protein ACUVTP_06215, partial [Candidatus Fervidibacter sp.]|uniref:hypothetical protein n=1 Tax=Candidatus Fervidibacter sp. TaxID=3100871 RepID=UPI00404B3473
MPSPSWKEIDFFEALISKAVKEALGDRQVSAETLTDLLMEGKAAAYEALKRYEPTKGDKTAWVFQSVVHHTRKVLRDYLPAGEALPDEVNGASVLLADSSTVSSRPLSPLAIAVLLAAAPPLERLYALHELLGWKRPPRYAKTRLKKRWQECEWVRLVTGNVRKGWEQLKLLKQLCLMAQEGNEHEKELAGFALATIPLDDLNDEGVSLVRSSAQTLLKSANPQHQFAGLWVLHRLQPDVWDGSWIDTLNINALGSVLKAPYAKPKECICPSPLCLHFHPDSLHRSPPSNIADSITESLIHYARRIVCERGQEVRWRGWWLARAVGLYMSFLPDLLPNDLPSMNRIGAMLATIALAHLAPQWGLEQSLEWLPRAPTVIERLRKALKSPEPLERSSALYAARALPLEDRLLLALSGLSDPSVLVRYTARRTMEECAL